uniref:GTP binding protein 2b n=1 Tax=Hucho hucho TaxID=62062 RepID=A0A4W5NWJ8_9TELE
MSSSLSPVANNQKSKHIHVYACTLSNTWFTCWTLLGGEVLSRALPSLQLKLVNPTQYRFEHLATQLKWRLQEGWGEAVYQIGVEDNGLLVGLSEGDMRASLKTLRRMAEKVGADITLLREREVDYDSDRNCRKIAEFLDLRVAVLGNVDSGKSTLLGVLTQGELDNGRGRARLNLFSISFEILGFNSKGEVVNYSDSRTAEEICESSSKMITFIDLAGHHKYLKTTIFGLTSYCPDFAMLVVSANTGIAGTTREHLGLAMALKVPIFIVVSKVDLCAKGTVERTVRQLEHVLKLPGCNKVPMVVARQDDAVTAGMVMVSPKMNPTICWQFEAAIVLLFHAKTFRRGFQVTVHVGNVRQTATVESLSMTFLSATFHNGFRFIKHPEYLRMGAKLLFREGVTKGIGHVTCLLPDSHDQNQIHDQNQWEIEKERRRKEGRRGNDKSNACSPCFTSTGRCGTYSA